MAEAVSTDRLFGLRGLERFGDWGRAQARDAELAYGQAYYAALLVAERYGAGAALAVLQAERDGRGLDAAFRAATGTSAEAFYVDALEYTRRRAVADTGTADEVRARRAP